jgi:urease accessory protein
MSILSLLQLASSTLPVGAYCYSEGLEILVEQGIIHNNISLRQWLEDGLRWGSIRIETALMLRAYNAAQLGDFTALNYWNGWASATRESEELRQQSWQMGRMLVKLLQDTRSRFSENITLSLCDTLKACGSPCNYAIVFGIAATYWQIDQESAILGYLYSWASNLVNAGVKLIPLGQTAGQQMLLDLSSPLHNCAQEVLGLEDDQLNSCNWGLSLASMAHETQYSRLFRS